jgi:hypothetical protein
MSEAISGSNTLPAGTPCGEGAMVREDLCGEIRRLVEQERWSKCHSVKNSRGPFGFFHVGSLPDPRRNVTKLGHGVGSFLLISYESTSRTDHRLSASVSPSRASGAPLGSGVTKPSHEAY